jgi:hypothetical protein
MSIRNCGASALASTTGSDHVLNFHMTARINGGEDVTFAHFRLEMKDVVEKILERKIFALVA